jgi:uncharacterized protein HemX
MAMTKETEERVQNLLTSLEKKNATANRLMWSLAGLIIAALVSFGAYSERQKELRDKVEFIDKNYIPMMFIEGTQTNQYYMVRDLVARLSGASKEEIDQITKEYREFQNQMNDQMIEMKKAMSPKTRSIQK